MESPIPQNKSEDSAAVLQALETSVKILARMIVKEVLAELMAQERLFGNIGVGLAAPTPSCVAGGSQPGRSLVYSVTEAAGLLGISRPNAYSLIQTGQLPCLRFGKRILIPRIALTKMLEDAASAKPA